MKVEKRIEELKYRIEKCGSTLSELEENVRRLKRMMSLYIEEKTNVNSC
jgi:prefoldin subunit 5